MINDASAAERVIALIRTPILNAANAALADHGDVGLWINDVRFANDGSIFDALSSGERYLVEVVQALYNGSGGATIAGLRSIDGAVRARLLHILVDLWD